MILGLLFFFISPNQSFENLESSLIHYIREEYFYSIEDDERLERFEDFIISSFGKDYNNYPPIISAYYGGIEALKSKHAFWPFDKLNHFNNSMNILKNTLERCNKNELEVRFMRFSILHYVPGFLGHGKERDEDRKRIVKLLSERNYSYLPLEIQKNITNFMLESGRLQNDELKMLNNIISLVEN